MGDIKDLGKERQKRTLQCMYCGKVDADKHPGYSCPRIASLYLDDEGGVYQIEFHDWQELPEASA